MIFLVFLISDDFSYIIIVPIYIACIFLLLYALYRKYHDENLLLGIFISAIFHEIIYVNFMMWLSYLFSLIFIGYLLFGFICGITAGLLNENMKRGAQSGAIGMLLSMTLMYPFMYFIIFVFGYYLVFQALPRMLGGAIGGAFGSQIRKRYLFKKKVIVKLKLN